MGKSSKATPQYSTGVVRVNGENKASHYKKGNTVYSDYKMSDNEKKIFDYAQNSFLQNLPNVNIFSEDVQKNLQNQIDAYAQKGVETIDKYYTPMISNLKNDIASRFGNFDNSVFMNNLSDLENNRADAMSALSQDVLAKRDELVSNELINRYNYLNFLNNVQNQSTANILNYLVQAANNAESGTAYNQNKANVYQNAANANQNQYLNLASAILASSGNPYGQAASVGLQLASRYL